MDAQRKGKSAVIKTSTRQVGVILQLDPLLCRRRRARRERERERERERDRERERRLEKVLFCFL